MKNTFTSPADFWQERDFGAKISASFEFIGEHWRSLGKCLVYFVLPFTLLMGVGLGLFNNGIYNMSGRTLAAQRAHVPLPHPASPYDMFNFSGLGLAFVGGILAFMLLSGSLYAYLRVRLRLPATEPVTTAQVWAELRARLGRIVLGFLLLLVIGLVGWGILLSGVVGGMSSIASGPGMTSLVFLLLMLASIYVYIVFALYFPVLWFEDRSVVASVGRCFQLIRGQWWSTFGLLLVALFLQSMLTIVFAIPQYAVMFGKMLQLPGLNSDILGLVATCFYALGIMFTYVLPLLVLAFQYFHLAEQKEGVGLRLLVDKLGHPQAIPVAHSSQYRPDDEGEY
ncbi:hypothetical protein [Hymenobacter sp. BRD67]|uniref:hypothetical protein n=1 Tax=Hymenobacter sp. BRD67 TaxID=2675877 RepID=UPI001563D5DB|nr:hypothetical protein [Hymenobacter sp. BRD67]QKG53463.1 hypothetical protein GKZ67_13730 [Hymenobacter sp. BRD67]